MKDLSFNRCHVCGSQLLWAVQPMVFSRGSQANLFVAYPYVPRLVCVEALKFPPFCRDGVEGQLLVAFVVTLAAHCPAAILSVLAVHGSCLLSPC